MALAAAPRAGAATCQWQAAHQAAHCATTPTLLLLCLQPLMHAVTVSATRARPWEKALRLWACVEIYTTLDQHSLEQACLAVSAGRNTAQRVQSAEDSAIRALQHHLTLAFALHHLTKFEIMFDMCGLYRLPDLKKLAIICFVWCVLRHYQALPVPTQCSHLPWQASCAFAVCRMLPE
jgi:hypothetical protein